MKNSTEESSANPDASAAVVPTTAMHSSLRPRTNLVLAGVWLAVALCFVMVLPSISWVMALLGFASGALQGFLQTRALRVGAASFLKARSALEVRAALTSTSVGRWQIRVLWGSVVVYVLAASRLQAGGSHPLMLLPLLVLLAISIQGFVRESMTVRASAALERRASTSSDTPFSRDPASRG